MSIEMTMRKLAVFLGGITALVAVASATGASLGFRFTGPGKMIGSLAQTDTVIFAQIAGIRDSLHQHDVDQSRFSDSLTAGLRPLRIFLCLRDTPENTAMMGLDCDTIIGEARHAAVLHRQNNNGIMRP